MKSRGIALGGLTLGDKPSTSEEIARAIRVALEEVEEETKEKTFESLIEGLREYGEVSNNLDIVGRADELEDWHRNDNDYKWRQEICDRLGMDISCGNTYTTDEVWDHYRWMEESAVRYALKHR